MKCESLVRSKKVEVDAGRFEFRKLKVPEPCGENGSEVHVFARKARQKSRAKDDAQQTFKGVREWHIERAEVSRG